MKKLFINICLWSLHYYIMSRNRSFPTLMEKATVFPMYKKERKQFVKNYKPVSILPIGGKIFKCLIYNEVYPHPIDNNLISSHQSSFKASDSCIDQLRSITHEIYKSFDEGFKVRMKVSYSSSKKIIFLVNYCYF